MMSELVRNEVEMNIYPSGNVNPQNDNFIKVSYKRRPKTLKKVTLEDIIDNPSCGEILVDLTVVLKRIENCKSELSSSDLYESVLASLSESLSLLEYPSVHEIICIGLGKFTQCLTSRYQLALLLCLKDLYKVEVYASDPLFSVNEKNALQRLDIKIIDQNFEGKFRVKKNATTVFYLPHCPKQLTNNLLWANWGLDLNYCLIIANSFHDIVENCSFMEAEKSANFILKIFPYTLEFGIINTFKYYEIFNNTAIHIFPLNNLTLISKDFWKSCLEPVYDGVVIEYIRNSS